MAMMTRRRFLGSLLAVAGVGGAGLAAWLAQSEQSTATSAATSTTSTTTSQPATTATTGAPTTTTERPATTTTTVAPVAGLPVICREAWGALPVAGEFILHEIGNITVHHTAAVLESNADAPGRVRQHQQYHQSRGWPDLAYHFIIDAAGNIYEGRPIDAVGDTGTDYDPTGHLLVCCEGDFSQQEITAKQYDSLVQVIAWGATEFDVDPVTVQGHRDLAATSCPGDRLYRMIADGTLATDVASADVPNLGPVCGAEGEALVAAIEAGASV